MADILERLQQALAERYTVERELGRGGMATVYLAHDRRHDRRVALKALRPGLAAAMGAERFLREIKFIAGLQHPHILPLYDSGDAEGTLFYVMPWVDGESLRDRLTRDGQLPLDEAIRITRGVGDALTYAHEHNVVHRDIKPENILLSGGHALVSDFGIARAITRAAGETLTQIGYTLGTPAYMSPEQASGDREIDGRSDIYALGCVVYEMLAGMPAFSGPTTQAVIAKHFREMVPSLRVVRPSVSEPVAAAVMQALAKAPADRHQSVAAFVTALESPAAAGATPAEIASPHPSRTKRAPDHAETVLMNTSERSAAKRQRTIVLAAVGAVVVALLIMAVVVLG